MPSLWRLKETPQGTYYREESQQKHFSRKARWPRTESDLHCRVESIESATTTRLIAWRKQIITLHFFYLLWLFFSFRNVSFHTFQFKFYEIKFPMQINAMRERWLTAFWVLTQLFKYSSLILVYAMFVHIMIAFKVIAKEVKTWWAEGECVKLRENVKGKL